jgi:hypothetical protein
MYYKFKVSNIPGIKGILTYLTTAQNFAEAAQKIINLVGVDPNIEEIKWMKNFKPAINDKTKDSNRLYIVKIAEDINDEGVVKTIKYELPVFADNSEELHNIVKNYIEQGFWDMRLTTISETKWIYVE